MATDNDTKKQIISYDNQNFDIDIDKIYSDFIKEIDAIRSYTNFNKNTAEKYIKSIDTTKSNEETIDIGVESTFQESRCHAFYRLIGLPVLASNSSHYSPGHDNIKEDRQIFLDDKREIALKPIDKFDDLITARENYLNTIVKIFSKPSSIDAGAMAISSGGCSDAGLANLREFSAPFAKSEEAFDMNVDNQKYTIDLNTLVGEKIVNLTEFQDPNGEPPYQLSLSKKHIIKPLLVSGKIDFCVRPATRRVCVPFVYDKTNTLISANVYAKRPLIEKIIRDRISDYSKTESAGPSSETLDNYIKNISSIKNESIIDDINNGELYEKTEFVKYLFIIQAIMKKLVQATDNVKKAQSLYYWVPQPSVKGPEDGFKVREVFVPTNITNDNLLTEKDRDILLMSIKNSVNNFGSTGVTPKNDESPDSFAFSQFSNTFDSDTSSALGNSAGEGLDDLVAERKSILTKSGNALRTIEIIMGEFSGLGLCDIIAVTAALHVIPIQDLVGLIDIDAFNRMEKILKTGGSISQTPCETAVKNLTKSVKDFYTIMDKIYLDELMNNGTTPD